MTTVVGWRLVDTEPGAAATPGELGARWDDTVQIGEPTTVGAIRGSAEAIDARDWWFQTSLSSSTPRTIAFEGVTAPATVFIDGQPVATVESMFLPVLVDVPAGRHQLSVLFPSLDRALATRRPRGRWRSSLIAAQGMRWVRTSLIGRAPVYQGPPAPVGFWRPVRFVPESGPREVVVRPAAASGRVDIAGVVSPDTPVTVAISYRGREVTRASVHADETGRYRLAATVPEPHLWWPRGYGDQSLYTVTTLVGEAAADQRVFGFRTVTATTSDGGFGIRVNDVAIFARGAVWMDPAQDAASPMTDALRRQLAHLAAAGANMIRIPGGTTYAGPELWSLCAEQGILVWQDVMLATFDPPDEVGDLLRRELQSLLRTVSGNPALTVISGGNETIQQPEMLGLDPAQRRIDLLHTVLPTVVSDEADVPYVAASPSAPAGSDDLAIRPDSGVSHWFGVGGYLRPLPDVRHAGVRFAAECLAFAIPASPAAVDRHFSGAQVAGHAPDWKTGVPRDRGSSWDFEDVRDHYVSEVFAVNPFLVRRLDPDRYLQLGRAAIAEAMIACYSWWRREDSRCDGALVLSARDLRPGPGWGLLDVDGDPKAPLDALSRVWAPIAVTATSEGLSGVRIDVYNDGPTPLAGTLALIATNSSGHRVADADTAVVVEPHSSVTFHDADLTGRFTDLSHAYGFGTAVADAVEVSLLMDGAVVARDVLVVTPRPGQARTDLTATAQQEAGDWYLTLQTSVCLRYVEITLAGWRPSDNFFHLAGGSAYVVRLIPHDGAREQPSGTVTSIDHHLPIRVVMDNRERES
ncbi:glycosyl hydrolase [Williamsia sp. 1138]|uniref:hypothetical protein n=1 Tax=Williamsia sp. 1138 TaxID=1903117 RepID=UPI000A120393|nr:hypothetical protein [Williamsia sp. 1138]OZG29180.1 glycosyl hydrolase [Williamsia sp. 1138]